MSYKLKPGYIYIVRCKKYHKIGIATDMHSRVKGLQTGNPFKIQLVRSKYVGSYKEKEKLMHDIFSSKSVRGEWFRLGKSDLKLAFDLIDSMNEEKVYSLIKEKDGGILKRVIHQKMNDYCPQT